MTDKCDDDASKDPTKKGPGGVVSDSSSRHIETPATLGGSAPETAPTIEDGRKLRRYQRRWMVERFFAWIQWQRGILIRWEYYAENFLGFIQLATMSILLRAILR